MKNLLLINKYWQVTCPKTNKPQKTKSGNDPCLTCNHFNGIYANEKPKRKLYTHNIINFEGKMIYCN